MDIKGAENLSDAEFADELRRGARVVEFSYCISIVVITFRRSSTVLVRAGEGTFGAGLPYTLLSLCFGWWGFPFGIIFTPIAVIQNLMGGTDHTARFAAALPQAPPMYPQQQYPQQQYAPPRTLVRVIAPDGTSYPAEPLGQDGALVHVRFADGTERWVPAESVRSQ